MFHPRFMAFSASLIAGLAAFTIQAAPAAAQEEGQVNLAAALDNTCVVGVMLPAKLRADESMDLLPWELITVAGQEEFGIDPATISRVFVFVKTPENLDRPPKGGMIVQLNQPVDPQAMVKALAAEAISPEGPTIYMSPKFPLAFTIANPTTIVAVSEPSMMASILTKPTEIPQGGLVDLVREAVKGNDAAIAISVDALREPTKPILAQAPPLPGPFENLKQLPDLISTITIRAKATGGGSLGMTITAVDEASGEKLETMANNWIQIGQQMALEQMKKDIQNDDSPYAAAMELYMQRVSAKVVQSLKPVRNGEDLVFLDHSEGPNINGMASTGVVVALLLPAVQAARESARRMSSSNNLKQIALAFHNYHDTYGKLPAQATYDQNGKPLLSWRVHILPFIEQQALYQQFKLDEPWDSPHNLELSKTIVPIYQNPNMTPSNKTVYLAPVGQGLIMDGNKQRRFQDILDGTSNTIMVVEADPGEAVVWTKPDDLEVDPDNPMKGLGNMRPGIFNATFADGSVQAISNAIDQAMLKAMFTIAGGEVVER